MEPPPDYSSIANKIRSVVLDDDSDEARLIVGIVSFSHYYSLFMNIDGARISVPPTAVLHMHLVRNQRRYTQSTTGLGQMVVLTRSVPH